MKDMINILSSSQFTRFDAMSNGIYNNQHVLMWDYDEEHIDLERLQQLVNKFKLNIHLIKTLHGWHLIDFHFKDVFEIETIQKAFQKYFPSTYPSILKVKNLDAEASQVFEGQTLRITRKASRKTDLVYCRNVICEDYEKELMCKPYSAGHLYTYKLVTEFKDMFEFGKPIRTKVNMCSFLDPKPKIRR